MTTPLITRLEEAAEGSRQPQGQTMTDKQRGALAAVLFCLAIIFGVAAFVARSLPDMKVATVAFTMISLGFAVWVPDAWGNKP